MSEEQPQVAFDREVDLSSKAGVLACYGSVAEGMRLGTIPAADARVWLVLLKQAGDLLGLGVTQAPKKGRKDVEDTPGPGPGAGVTPGGPMSGGGPTGRKVRDPWSKAGGG